jgi:hypothetical protein
MNDQLDKRFADLRAEALREVLPPGPDAARRTVRRRQGVATSIGAVVAVGAVVSAMAVAGAHLPQGTPPAASSASPEVSVSFPTQPDPVQVARMEAAAKALGTPDYPRVMATAAVIPADGYENHVNDIPAGDYRLSVYCVGKGTLDVVVKAGQYGDKKLAGGKVTCAETPVPGKLSVRQPYDGYLRVFMKGDHQAAGRAGIAFKFDRTAG